MGNIEGVDQVYGCGFQQIEGDKYWLVCCVDFCWEVIDDEIDEIVSGVDFDVKQSGQYLEKIVQQGVDKLQ